MLSIEKPLYRVWKFDGEKTFLLDYEATNWDEAKVAAYMLYAQGYEVLMNEKYKPTAVHVKTNSAVWGFALGPEFFAQNKNGAQIVEAGFFEQFRFDVSGYVGRITKELSVLASELDSDARRRGIVAAVDDPVFQAQMQNLREVTAAINSGALLLTARYADGKIAQN